MTKNGGVRRGLTVLGSGLAMLVLTAGAGCSQDVTEAEGTTAAAQTASKCGDARNPACDVKSFVVRAWELANEDPKANFVDPIVDAKDCVKGLAEILAITVATDGLAAPVIASSSAVIDGVKTILSCKSFGEYLSTTGIGANLSCLFDPVVYNPTVQACQCTEHCQGGVWNTGGFDGEPLKARTKFKYGFLDRAGSANCYCTNQPKEVTCHARCTKWASTSATDCKCNSLY